VIPANLDRTLASWRRLTADPQTGHLIDCGRTPVPAIAAAP
jgi:hypothetical protein